MACVTEKMCKPVASGDHCQGGAQGHHGLWVRAAKLSVGTPDFQPGQARASSRGSCTFAVPGRAHVFLSLRCVFQCGGQSSVLRAVPDTVSKSLNLTRLLGSDVGTRGQNVSWKSLQWPIKSSVRGSWKLRLTGRVGLCPRREWHPSAHRQSHCRQVVGEEPSALHCLGSDPAPSAASLCVCGQVSYLDSLCLLSRL